MQKIKNDGLEAVLFVDGLAGLQKIRDWKPDLILLDIILPTMNGYEILEEKFKDSSIKDIPVIVISNSGQPVEINRVLSLGIKDYLVKAQFDPEEVMVKVRAQLRNEEAKKDDAKNVVFYDKNLEGKKILWVEDDKFLNDIIARKLTSIKCQFFHTASGEEALKIISEQNPDIVMLDVVLPGMNGYDILKKIKEDEKSKNIPIIMLSNLGEDTDKNKAVELGAKKYLIKASVTLDDIIDEISKILSNK